MFNIILLFCYIYRNLKVALFPTTFLMLIIILILMCQGEGPRNLKGNLMPPKLLRWNNAIGFRPSSCVVQRPLFYFFGTFNFFRTTWSFLIFGLKHCYNTFWKITDYEKYFSKCINFGISSISFEKKIFQLASIACTSKQKWCKQKKDTLVMLIKNKIIFYIISAREKCPTT